MFASLLSTFFYLLIMVQVWICTSVAPRRIYFLSDVGRQSAHKAWNMCWTGSSSMMLDITCTSGVAKTFCQTSTRLLPLHAPASTGSREEAYQIPTRKKCSIKCTHARTYSSTTPLTSNLAYKFGSLVKVSWQVWGTWWGVEEEVLRT